MRDVLWMATFVLFAGCVFDTSGSNQSGSDTDANRSAPDADPTAPDADPATPDADRDEPDAVSPVCATTYTESHGGNLYRLESVVASWYEAQAACEAEGARLVVIDSQAEDDFVLALEPTGNIWVGMSDHMAEQGFVWLTGDSAMGDTGGYQHWIGGQPNDNLGGEDCGEIFNVDGWNDQICSFPQVYVCECGGTGAAVPATWCETRTTTDCDVCGDVCAGGEACVDSACS